MPFPQQTPREFTKQNIENITPNQYGVYGLFRSGTWIYIGRGDIRTRLLAHFNGDNSRITKEKPTHWVDCVTKNEIVEEKNLILEFDPICNRKVG